MDVSWITLIWEIATTLVDKGLLSKDKLPKDFPKTTDELEKFVLDISKKHADEIVSQTYEIVDEWED